MRVLNHIVNEDGHALAQPHLKVLLMRHVTGEQKEGIAVPLNPYMIDAVMGGDFCLSCIRFMESNGPDVPSNSLSHPAYDPG